MNKNVLKQCEETTAGLVNWPGVYECFHSCSEEQDHTGAGEGSSTLLLLLHRVTSLQLWIHKPQGELVGVFPLQTDETREPQQLHHMLKGTYHEHVWVYTYSLGLNWNIFAWLLIYLILSSPSVWNRLLQLSLLDPPPDTPTLSWFASFRKLPLNRLPAVQDAT